MYLLPYHMKFLLDFSFKAWECRQKSWLGDFGPNAGKVHRRRWKEQYNEGYCIIRRSIFCNIHCYEGEHIKGYELGRAHSMHGRDEKCLYVFCWKAEPL
jgi:hypothetical protein